MQLNKIWVLPKFIWRLSECRFYLISQVERNYDCLLRLRILRKRINWFHLVDQEIAITNLLYKVWRRMLSMGWRLFLGLLLVLVEELLLLGRQSFLEERLYKIQLVWWRLCLVCGFRLRSILEDVYDVIIWRNLWTSLRFPWWSVRCSDPDFHWSLVVFGSCDGHWERFDSWLLYCHRQSFYLVVSLESWWLTEGKVW